MKMGVQAMSVVTDAEWGQRRQNFEHVLANINKLNRSLEAVIAVS